MQLARAPSSSSSLPGFSAIEPVSLAGRLAVGGVEQRSAYEDLRVLPLAFSYLPTPSPSPTWMDPHHGCWWSVWSGWSETSADVHVFYWSALPVVVLLGQGGQLGSMAWVRVRAVGVRGGVIWSLCSGCSVGRVSESNWGLGLELLQVGDGSQEDSPHLRHE